jgi:hypothetical protein
MEKDVKNLLPRVKRALRIEDVLIVDESARTALIIDEWEPFLVTFEATSCNAEAIINTILARRPTFITNLSLDPSPAGPLYRQLSMKMK